MALVVITQNVLALLIPPQRSSVERTLIELGLSPQSLEINAVGLHGDARFMMKTACALFKEFALQQNGQVDSFQHDQIILCLSTLVDGGIPTGLVQIALDSKESAIDAANLSYEAKAEILGMFADYFSVIAPLDPRRMPHLVTICARLGFDEACMRKLAQVTYQPLPRPHGQCKTTQDAWAILSLGPDHSMAEFRRSYRQKLLHCNQLAEAPRLAPFTDLCSIRQEIEWAYSYILAKLPASRHQLRPLNGVAS
jgi:hypothetical protein